MASITLKTITDSTVWESFLATHPEANFLQSWHWGTFHERLQHPIIRTGFYDGEQLVGIMLSVVEPAKRGRYLTVPGGPIIDWNNPAHVEAFSSEVRRLAHSHKCVFVRVRPQLELNDASLNLFRQMGFVDAPMHLHAELTSQLDITKSEDELMADMRKATRYEIRKAEKLGISLQSSTDAALIPEFYDLQIDTSKRQGFVPFSFEFLNEQFKVFAEQNQALLYTTEFEGKKLAQAFIIFYGSEAVYHYGASTADGRKYPGAYLIQWEAIKEAKRRGMTRYNFWGVAPEDNPQHRFYGLSIFKRGFGGQDFSYVHAQDLVINKPFYMFNLAVEQLRKKIRSV